MDEYYNTDFGGHMKPPVTTVPSNQAHPGTDGTVWALAVQPDDKAIIAGEFTTYNGTPFSCIARAMPGGPFDASFTPGTGSDDGIISSLALLPDGSGKMMIGGTFSFYDDSYSPFIARLNSNGRLDATFAPINFPDGPVWALAIQPSNQVVIAGDFLNIGIVPRAHVARYNADGSLDLTFDPSANAPTNGSVLCLAIQPDGKVVIGGSFANLGSQPLSGLARLNADGSADTAFDTNLGFGVDGVVQAVAIQGGTNVVIGGEFQNVGIAQRTRIARLNSDGTVDNTFNSGTGADDTVYNISAQPDGSMYVGGLFTTFNGTHRLGFTRLYADGTVDTTFLDTAYNQFAGLHRKYYDRQWTDPINPDPNPDPRPFVAASQVLPDGNVVIGGGFTQVGGGQADAAIRFDSDYPSSSIDTNVWTEPKSRDGVRNRSNFARLIGGSTPGPGNIGLLYNSYSVNQKPARAECGRDPHQRHPRLLRRRTLPCNPAWPKAALTTSITACRPFTSVPGGPKATSALLFHPSLLPSPAPTATGFSSPTPSPRTFMATTGSPTRPGPTSPSLSRTAACPATWTPRSNWPIPAAPTNSSSAAKICRWAMRSASRARRSPSWTTLTAPAPSASLWPTSTSTRTAPTRTSPSPARTVRPGIPR